MRRKRLTLAVSVVLVTLVAAGGLAVMSQLSELMWWLVRDDC